MRLLQAMLLAAVSILVLLAWSQGPPIGSLAACAASAKRRGLRSTGCTDTICPVDGNLGELLIDYSLVTARLSRLAARQTHDLNAIFTWDVLSDVEVLSPASTKSECRFEAPKGLWLQPGESVIPRYGGTVVISGIEVKVAAGRIAPISEEGQRYAFLANVCPQRVMTLPLSGFDVFKVFDDGRISPARGHVNLEFQQQMTALGNLDALQRFASRIRSLPRP